MFYPGNENQRHRFVQQLVISLRKAEFHDYCGRSKSGLTESTKELENEEKEMNKIANHFAPTFFRFTCTLNIDDGDNRSLKYISISAGIKTSCP